MSLETYVNAANALLWLGQLGQQGVIKFIDRPPVFHLTMELTGGVIAVTYSREHQRWVILSNNTPEMAWFGKMPWATMMVGDDFIMPVCRDIPIPDEYREEGQAFSLPKFALRLECISAVAQAVGQQQEVMVGTYRVNGMVTELEYINMEPVRVLRRKQAA